MRTGRWTATPSGSGRHTLLVLWVTVVSLCLAGRAQDVAPEVVEVFHQGRTLVRASGITDPIVLDESICRAEISGGQIQLFGLARGETVLVAWMRDQRIAIRIRVVERPEVPPPPTLSRGALESLGHGSFGSSVQTAIGMDGEPTFFLLHNVEWQQQNGGSRLSIRAQAQDNTMAGAPVFNANLASISYEDARAKVSLMDFPLEVNGGLEAKISPYSAYNVYMVRGADVKLRRGANQFELFAGATIPSYFLRLNGARETSGVNFTRKQNSRLFLYGTAGWVAAPAVQSGSAARRENSIFGTAGFAWRPDERWAIQGTAGGSTRGVLAQGTVSYIGPQLTAFVTGTASSPNFPLNQLQLLFSGGSSVTASTTLRPNKLVAASVYFQHSTTRPTVFFPAQSTGDYLNPNLTFTLPRRQSITLNYTYSRYRSNLLSSSQSQNQRIDAGLHSQFGARISNTAQFDLGSLNDSRGINSDREFTVRDALNISIRPGSLFVGVEHSRHDPSLIKRLNEQIGLLPPVLQQLFQLDPQAVAQSPDLPPDIRALLEHIQPTDTQISVGAQFGVGKRLNLSPNAGYIRDAPGLTPKVHSYQYGYSLSCSVTRSLQLTSSMTNVLLFDPKKEQLQRSTVVTMGLNKTFTGGLHAPLFGSFARRTIRGRVFRDLNQSGTFNSGEPGMAGVRVVLSSGDVKVTDAEGRFEYSKLSPGAYSVSLPLNQFNGAVRLTGPAEIRAELFEQKAAEINFGVVDFARLIGNVYNDYLLDGNRRPDSNGLRGVRLVLTGGGIHRPIVTDGAGDYGLDGVAPGDYELTLDRTTLPTNFNAPGDPIRVHIAPVSTAVNDIPVRALRSISGHVYVARGESGDPNGNPNVDTAGGGKNGAAGPAGPAMLPVAGVQLAIGQTMATTDAGGGFILRDLPAGELTLRVVPAQTLPPGMVAPTGKTKLPHEPIQVENATIVISNPKLVEYLLPRAITPLPRDDE